MSTERPIRFRCGCARADPREPVNWRQLHYPRCEQFRQRLAEGVGDARDLLVFLRSHFHEHNRIKENTDGE